jgi:hypothetical protein
MAPRAPPSRAKQSHRRLHRRASDEDQKKAKTAPAPRPAFSSAPPLAEPPFLSEPPASSKAAPLTAAFAERKLVVKELKEIVKILDRGKKQ